MLLAAVGIDGDGVKHPLGVLEGATENAAVVQALLDNLVERGLDPKVCRLFIIDGSKALRKAIRRTFGKHTPIQRCQVHKGRNIMERLPKHLHASVRRTLRQAWELDDAAKAEQLIRNLARRLEQVAPGVSATILEGMDELLTVVRLKLPLQLRRSLACTNIIENMMGSIRRVCRNLKRWRDAPTAPRSTGAAMLEAAKGFGRLKAHKHLPVLRRRWLRLQEQNASDTALAPDAVAAHDAIGQWPSGEFQQRSGTFPRQHPALLAQFKRHQHCGRLCRGGGRLIIDLRSHRLLPRVVGGIPKSIQRPAATTTRIGSFLPGSCKVMDADLRRYDGGSGSPCHNRFVHCCASP